MFLLFIIWFSHFQEQLIVILNLFCRSPTKVLLRKGLFLGDFVFNSKLALSFRRNYMLRSDLDITVNVHFINEEKKFTRKYRSGNVA
jgi:hypothetical protein